MMLFRNRYRIESARLRGWDYSSEGSYFVTICTQDRDNLFGRVVKGNMELNQYGIIVNQCWFDLPNHYENIRLDAFVVMPNHVHGIIIIDNRINYVDVETGLKPVSTVIPTETVVPNDTIFTNKTTKPMKHHGLFEFVRAFKTFSGRRINELRQSPGKTVWQPRFHDHIIRDIDEYYRIRQYIINNPKHLFEN